MPPHATILIPAYNEAAVIGDTLRHLRRDIEPGEFNVIVLCNACKDNSADLARAAMPEATVLETQTPGKTNALRMGFDADTSGAPSTVFLDADLLVTAQDIRNLIEPLNTGKAMASHGGMDVDRTGCSLMVRAFYSVWMRGPYLKNGKFGGLFALSQSGVDRVSPLPDIIADDEFIARHFNAEETAYVKSVRFTARAPKRLRDLLAVRRRSLRGTRALAAMKLPPRAPVKGSSLRAVRFAPWLWPSAAVYIGVNLWVRTALVMEGPEKSLTWERDLSNRPTT